MHKDIESAIKTYGNVRDQYVQTYSIVTALREKTKNKSYSLEDMVDLLMIMRRSSRFVDDARKEIEGLNRILESTICVLYTQKYANDPTDIEPVRGELAVGSPKARLQANVPTLKKDPEQYIALMKHFGLSTDTAEKDMLRVHWPALGEYLTNLAENGDPLPPGIEPGKTFPVYSVTVRNRNAEVDIDSLLDEIEERESSERTNEDG